MSLKIISHPQDFVAVEPARVPIGRVAEVHGPVVDIACETLPPLHRALQLSIDGGSAVLEVLHHLDSHHVRAIALHRTAGLQLVSRRASATYRAFNWRRLQSFCTSAWIIISSPPCTSALGSLAAENRCRLEHMVLCVASMKPSRASPSNATPCARKKSLKDRGDLIQEARVR